MENTTCEWQSGASRLAVLTLAIAGTGLTGCGPKDPPPFDPRVPQQLEKDASYENAPVEMHAFPTTLIDLSTRPAGLEDQEPGGGNGVSPNPHVHLRKSTRASTGRSLAEDPSVRMSLQDIIHRSVVYSAEVKVAGYDPAIAKTRVLEAEARFDPTLFINAKHEHQDTPFAGQTINLPDSTTGTQTLFVERGEVMTLEPGVKQLLESGGELSLSYQTQYNYLLPRRFVLNPYWDDQLKLQITQPLLRNAGYAVNQARITIARNDAHVSILDFRKTLEDNIAELEKDYWQSQEAEQEVIIQESLLHNTRHGGNPLWPIAPGGRCDTRADIAGPSVHSHPRGGADSSPRPPAGYFRRHQTADE